LLGIVAIGLRRGEYVRCSRGSAYGASGADDRVGSRCFENQQNKRKSAKQEELRRQLGRDKERYDSLPGHLFYLAPVVERTFLISIKPCPKQYEAGETAIDM